MPQKKKVATAEAGAEPSHGHGHGHGQSEPANEIKSGHGHSHGDAPCTGHGHSAPAAAPAADDDHGHGHGHGHSHDHGGGGCGGGDDHGDDHGDHGHDHGGGGGDDGRNTARTKLLKAVGFSGCLMIAEAVGGYMSGSLAILTDAAHLLSDVTGFCISLLAIWLGSRKANARMTYGYRRAEVLGALVSVVLIWVLTAVLVVEAAMRARRWFAGESLLVDGKLMFFVALGGCAVNMALLQILGHDHGGGGHHGHSHGPAPAPKKRQKMPWDEVEGGGNGGGGGAVVNPMAISSAGSVNKPLLVATTTYGSTSTGHDDHDDHGHGHGGDSGGGGGGGCSGGHGHDSAENINIRAAYIHALGDMAQSVGVVIAGAIVWARPDWEIADPACTFLFSILVVFTTTGIVKDAIDVLMEGVPTGIDADEVKAALAGVPGAKHVHDLHIWSLTAGVIALSVHITADAPETQEVLVKAEQVCRTFDIGHSTIQVQATGSPGDEACATGACQSKACEW
jgi:solute carrier family 30 (zinc transporter), member 2